MRRTFPTMALLIALMISSIAFPVVANQAPVADAGDDKEAKVGARLMFGGGGSSDPDGDGLSYSWDFDATNGIQKESNLMAPSHTYSVAGIYTVTLTVSDGELESTDTISVKINKNLPPIVDLGPDVTANVNEWIYLDKWDTADPNDDPLTYSWDFDASNGIQEEGTEQIVQWKYTKEGNYKVTLTVSDGEFTVNGTINVSVTPGLVPIPGKKYDGGGSLEPGQRNVYLVPLSKGKGLKVTIQANDGKRLNYYTFESKHFFKFVDTGDIMALSSASKENANKLSYSIKASKTDDYYIVVLNPSTAQGTVEYTIDTKTVSADQANGPGFSGLELVVAMIIVSVILVLVKKRNN